MKKLPLIITLFTVGLMTQANADSYTAVSDYTTTTVIQQTKPKPSILTTDEVLTRVVDLANSDDILNLKKSAIALGANDIGAVQIKLEFGEHSVKFVYHNNNPDYPIASITHDITVGRFGDIELTEIHKSVSIDFKPQFCPSIDELKNKFGKDFHSVEMPTSPDLMSGMGSSYTTHHVSTKKHLVFIHHKGCELSVIGTAKFE